ncbi:FadD3 family acyl-CoA ligase [Litorivivens sp.]|uniref:FadD3 family acyl-CoA ligase n=2 Tax=Litorivivens sp. TaxID=2020868 RepID=UPI003565B994
MSDTKLPLSLPALIAWAANEYKDQVAIKEETRRVSYAELAGLAQRSAAAFLAAGVNKGDRVAIWAPNMTEWIEAAIGLQSAGAVLVPLNNRLQGAEAADILRRSGARILLTYTRLEKGEPLALLESESLPELEKRILLRGEDARAQTWDDFLAGGDNLNRDTVAERAASVAPDDIADMLFTSGTTGKPKGVLCTHRQNIQVFKTWGDTVGLRSSDNYLIINPFFHTFGYKAGWLASIIFGSTTLPVMAFDKEAAMAQIESDQVTMLPGAPSLYEMLLADPARDNYDLSSLRLGVTGAAAVPVQLVKDMRSVLGFKTVVTAYGLTESTGVVSICRPDDDAETIATTSGRAIEGVEVKCANPDTGAEVPRGSEGEIWVRGYNVMQGYFDMPEATAETITSDGWLRTGDIGVMDERGYLRITDRLKDMYIMNGENVYPAEVEKALYGLEGVAQVAVIGVPKQPQGEVGMAFIVPKPGSDPDKDAVIEHASRHLARYKVPMYVEIVDSLPLNASGKVVKPELKAKAKAILGNG